MNNDADYPTQAKDSPLENLKALALSILHYWDWPTAIITIIFIALLWALGALLSGPSTVSVPPPTTATPLPTPPRPANMP